MGRRKDAREGRGVHHKTLVSAAVEVRHRKPGSAQDKRKDGRYAGRVRLTIAADRSAEFLVWLCRECRHARLDDRHRRLERLTEEHSRVTDGD